jgi:hypothetical protein
MIKAVAHNVSLLSKEILAWVCRKVITTHVPDGCTMTHLLLALLLLNQSVTPPNLGPMPVVLADTKPNYRTHSSPACPDWRAAREGSAKDSDIRVSIYQLWVLGYITGFNIVGPDPTGDLLGSASQDEIYTAIDAYCALNPSNFVDDAMRPIADAIIRRREVPALSPPVEGVSRRAIVRAAVNCRNWVQGRSNDITRLGYVVVLHGYLTAYNRWGPDALGDAIGADDQTVTEAAADKWCSEHPSSLLIGTITPLIEHVASEHAAGRLPPGGVRPNDKMTPTAPITVASYAMAKQSTRPSILPEIAQMQPVLDCVMSAPSKSEAQICLEKAGIEDAESLPTDPKTVNEFKTLVISFSFMLDRDPNRRPTPGWLDRAVDYAFCVETAAYSNKGFSSRKKQQLEVALARAETACSSHPLSYRSLDPQNFEAATNLQERMFARALANIATKYALEANNWYPEEMRPCIRYLDGRPPSAGCSRKSGTK